MVLTIRPGLFLLVILVLLVPASCGSDGDKLSVPDATPPGQVTDLWVLSVADSSATLTWTAPGDDGMTGMATQYDLRYSRTPISEGGWGTAHQVTDVSSPKTAGNGETHTLTGLAEATVYYFALTTADEVPNWSGLSNVAEATTLAERICPAAVTDMAVAQSSPTSLVLAWTAPGDDGLQGQAAEYDLRFDTSPITEENWSTATPVPGVPEPQPSGAYETTTVTQLEGLTTYYFALKTADEVPNWSDLSNIAEGTTLAEQVPPAEVTDLSVSASTATSVTLNWTAPGDNGSQGTAAEYDVRYSTSHLELATWTYAPQAAGEPSPQPSGSIETFAVSGLNPDTEYYFSLKTRDAAGNWSGMAPQAYGKTDMEDPVPVFTSDLAFAPANMSITLCQSFTLTAVVENQGGSSGNGGIFVSFPQLDHGTDSVLVRSSSIGDEPGHAIHAAGQEMVDSNCQSMTTDYLQAEFQDVDWENGETNAYTLTVTPRQAGAFEVLVRSTMARAGAACEFVNGLPENGIDGFIDQQGWAVKRFAITVEVGLPPQDGFVLIQPGTFIMGSPVDETGSPSDETQHQVTLTKAFYISNQEVTQGEWETVMGWNDSYHSGDRRPVEWVTWFDTIEFCNRKSQSEGLTPVYKLDDVSYGGYHIESATVSWDQNADGYRLPTEAEWEYACRAASTTAFCNGSITQANCQPTDPNLVQVGWYCGNANWRTHDVMGRCPNAWSLYDMHGNVREYCWDRYGLYSGPEVDPTGPTFGSYRIVRGGGYNNDAQHCRSAFRSYGQGGRDSGTGLRLARTAT